MERRSNSVAVFVGGVESAVGSKMRARRFLDLPAQDDARSGPSGLIQKLFHPDAGFFFPSTNPRKPGVSLPLSTGIGSAICEYEKPGQAGEPPATSSRTWFFDRDTLADASKHEVRGKVTKARIQSVGRCWNGRDAVVTKSRVSRSENQFCQIHNRSQHRLGDAQREALEKLHVRLQIRAKDHDRDGSLVGLLPTKDLLSSTRCGISAGCTALDGAAIPQSQESVRKPVAEPMPERVAFAVIAPLKKTLQRTDANGGPPGLDDTLGTFQAGAIVTGLGYNLPQSGKSGYAPVQFIL